MKIAVVSDSHNMSPFALRVAADAIRPHRPELLIHLGDGCEDAPLLASELNVPYHAVKGNCDFAPDIPKEIILPLRGHRILICHGHEYTVKMSLMRLLFRARELNADIALYGHTHFQLADEQPDMLLLNPGTLMNRRYAIVEIEGAKTAHTLMIY